MYLVENSRSPFYPFLGEWFGLGTINFQYLGENTIPLHKQINIHRKGKTGSGHVIKLF